MADAVLMPRGGRVAEARAAAAPLAAVLGVIGGLYVAQSVVTGVTLVALPAILRGSGLPLERIGLVYLALLPWVLKGLWSGAVERYRLPPAGRPHTPRIVALGTLISALALAAAAMIGPTAFGPVLACLFVAALATATVDIACDGFAVETLSARQRGWGNAAQVGGAYLGLSIGGALFLILTAEAGWTAAALVTTALILSLGLPFVLLAPGLGADARRKHRPSLAAALRNPRIRIGLLLVTVFDLGLRLGQSMLGPFLIDAGLSLKAVGLINGLGGAGIGLLGTLVGGAAVRRVGSAASVRIAIVAQGLALVVLALAAASGLRVPDLLGALAQLAAATAAFGFVALYAELMGYASPAQAGIDFTLFQCADALIALLGGAASGVLAGWLGYPACFALAACTSLAAALAAPRPHPPSRAGSRHATRCRRVPCDRRRPPLRPPQTTQETCMMEATARSASGDFDLSDWPVARYRMPEHVPDAEADARIAEFDALLARTERFVLVFHGPEMPKDSLRFMKAYRAWFNANKEIQKRLCAGAVRVEPDPGRRKSFTVKALSMMNKLFLPYPYTVVGSDTEAQAQAMTWLTKTRLGR